jgi:hypothetical protein
LALSVCVSTQALPHAVVPAPHTSVHTPPMHALLPAHAVTQAPQLFGSVDVSVHAPLHAV